MKRKILILAVSLGIAVLPQPAFGQSRHKDGDKFDKAGNDTKKVLKAGGEITEKGLDAIGTGVKATVDHTGGRDTHAGESSKAAMDKAGEGADTGLDAAGKGLGAAVEHTGRDTTNASKATAGAMKKTGKAIAEFFGGKDEISGHAARKK